MHACFPSALSYLSMKALCHVQASQPPEPGAKQTSVVYKLPSLWTCHATEMTD